MSVFDAILVRFFLGFSGAGKGPGARNGWSQIDRGRASGSDLDDKAVSTPKLTDVYREPSLPI